MKKLSALIATVLCLLTLASCSSGKAVSDNRGDPSASAVDKGAYGNESSAGSDNAALDEDTTANLSERKLIRNVDLSVETKAFDALIDDLPARAKALGGYIEQSSIDGNSYDTQNQSRHASVTCRIPADKLDEFLASIGENCNVVSQSEQVQDVTLSYVDLESRIKALETERDALMALLEDADSTADILAIQTQLTDVIYRLESAVASLRSLSDQVDFSTVVLSVREVKVYTETAELTVWERISTGFMDSLTSVGGGIVDFVVFLIVGLPFIVLFAAIGVGIFFIVRALKKRKRASPKQ